MANNIKKDINKCARERRKFPRLKISVAVDYSITLDNKSIDKKKTKSKNIGSKGICIFAYENIKIGTILDLKFEFSKDGSIIETKGRLLWSHAFKISPTKDTHDKIYYELGIEFIGINEWDTERIYE